VVLELPNQPHPVRIHKTYIYNIRSIHLNQQLAAPANKEAAQPPLLPTHIAKIMAKMAALKMPQNASLV